MLSREHFDPTPQILGDSLSSELARVIYQDGGAPPSGTWCSGDAGLLAARPRVAIIGSRVASPESLKLIESLAIDLVSRGATIVSGAARGTDMAAHLAALAAGGTTVACVPFGLGSLVCGMGRTELLAAATPKLVLLSPFVPSQVPTRTTPIIRNRLIAALADVVVAGEAGVNSGTMHCLKFAFSLGRPVFYMRVANADAPLQNLHKHFAQLGGVPFSAGEISPASLAGEVIARAREFARTRTNADAAQLSLLGDS